jgi:hypothetical protein
MTGDGPRREYVEARRVLLDALTALEPHIEAFVLIGAQAVYLHSAGRSPGYQPFTTDADLALDQSGLPMPRYSPTRWSQPDSYTAATHHHRCINPHGGGAGWPGSGYLGDSRNRDIELMPGEFCIVPRGVEHRPVAIGVVHVLLFEPAITRNTGTVNHEYTIEPDRLEKI